MRNPRTVVVTGASAGVGRAVAEAFGARGDRVALLARGEVGLQAAADAVERGGGKALAIGVDVADPVQVFDATERVEQEFGPPDVWVNVAFSSIFAPLWEIDPAEFKRATEVTYLGFVYATMAALRSMRPRNAGTIVEVGSALAYRGIPLQSAYCGSKHAIQGFTESLRCELLHEKSKVRVTMVQLPAVNTPQFSWVRNRLAHTPQPVPPIYQPEVVARAILGAADHPRRREYWVGTSTALTLCANAIAPGLLDRYLARTGFDSQQTDNVQPPDDRAGNLFAPRDGVGGSDRGSHGRFDDQSSVHDPQIWASQHHGALAGLAGVAVAGALGVSQWAAKRRR